MSEDTEHTQSVRQQATASSDSLAGTPTVLRSPFLTVAERATAAASAWCAVCPSALAALPCSKSLRVSLFQHDDGQQHRDAGRGEAQHQGHDPKSRRAFPVHVPSARRVYDHMLNRRRDPPRWRESDLWALLGSTPDSRTSVEDPQIEVRGMDEWLTFEASPATMA